MAISQIGNIAHINQNTLLNSQLQANNLNQVNVQSAINIQEFSDKMQQNTEVRPMEGIEQVNKDSSNKNAQYEDSTDEKSSENSDTKEQHINIYASDDDSSSLNIEV